MSVTSQIRRRNYLTPEQCAEENAKGFVHLCRDVKRVARREGMKVSTREAELVARTVFTQRQLVADGEAGASLGHSDETGETAIYRRLQVITTEYRS